MDKKSYRVCNWREYNEALVNRGSITFWFSDECITEWVNQERTGKKGRPKLYNNCVIECGLILKSLFGRTFRATEGLIRSLVKLLGLALPVPDYTLLCKRQKHVSTVLLKQSKEKGSKLNILVDTTGIKVYGEGEWKVRQHGWIKHRLWRKLHVAVNEANHEIEAFELTDLGVQDCEGLPLLAEQINGEIGTMTGDGAYDRFSCYEEAEKYGFDLITPPQRNAVTSKERYDNKKKASEEAVKKRDSAITRVRSLGRKEWKIQSAYHKRSLAETMMFRIKTLLGNRLSARKFENQKIEMLIWCKVINKITSLGMPNTLCIN